MLIHRPVADVCYERCVAADTQAQVDVMSNDGSARLGLSGAGVVWR